MFNPFRADVRVIVPGVCVPRIDVGGIYVLATTGKVFTEGGEAETVDFGINPCQWRELPNEGILLWEVRHPVNSNEASYAATVVVPNLGASTVTSPNTTTGTTKVPIVDNKGTQAQGSDVTNPTDSGETSPLGFNTEHLVYFNKSAGIFRLLGVKAQNSPARSTGGDSSDTPAVASAKKTAAPASAR